MGFCDDVKAAAEQIVAAPEITIISHIDADGIALAAIQELAKQVQELKEENKELHAEIQKLKNK